MAYVETWDETKPAGSRDANLGDDDIREFKRAIRERLAGGGMNFPSTDDANAGLFNYIKFIEQSSNPTSEANRAFFFAKDVSGVTELYWMDSAGTVTQITSGGKILISSLVIASEAQGDIIYRAASLWARLAAGTSGQFLKTQGAAANPTWADVAFQTAATQAEQEAGSVTNAPVTPGRQHFHPSAAKAFIKFNGATAAIARNYNAGTVARNSAGYFRVTFDTAMSDANYIVAHSIGGGSSNSVHAIEVVDQNASYFEFKVRQTDNQALVDATGIMLVFFGDI